MGERCCALASGGRPLPRARFVLALLCVLGLLTTWSARGAAQSPLDQPVDPGALNAPAPAPGGPGMMMPGGKMPKTHAASGAESEAKLPTQEPSLPEDPNAIPPQVAEVIGSDAPRDYESGRTRETERSWYGLWYGETSGSYEFQTLFPFWFQRRQPEDEASFYFPLYYRRRSTAVDADVLFPLFWKTRYGDTDTTIVGPVVHGESPKGHKNWLVPFYFEGTGDDGKSGYFHIPPLLTFTQHTDHDGFNLVGPLFCSWKGGPDCDPRTTDEIDLGLVPLYFYGRTDRSEYEVIPPLLHYYGYEEQGDHQTDVWGPLWMERDRDGGVFDILPLFWHNWGKDEQHTTFFPLFHYGYEGAASLLVTPLFLLAEGDEGEDTFVTWGYARYRGRTELDMVTPLFWRYADPDLQLSRYLLFPFFYSESSPRSEDVVVFPFYAQFMRQEISRTWWVTPLFRHQRSITGWETDLYPIFYLGRENYSTHFVLAPIVWDFASPKDRATVVFPLYWRFANQDALYQLVGNTYYHEARAKGGGKEWEFHFFPLFSYGETPQGHWWNLLYGMAGYTREGTMSKMRVLYIPWTLSE